MALPIGTRLGPYEVVGVLGAGGMGEVYRAHDARLERDVALKVLPLAIADDETARRRLVREARTAAKLSHPNICAVFDVGDTDRQVYLAMELVDGVGLDTLVNRGRLAPDQVMEIGLQVARAIGHAHDAGMLHRDLKAANVIRRPDGQVKVLDFGLALPTSGFADAATRGLSGMVAGPAGTLHYMAPETIQGQEATIASDVWSLGVLLHELAAGERPFQGATAGDLCAQIVRDPPKPLPPDVSPVLATVIRRALQKDPARRYATMHELRAALEVASNPAVDTSSVAPARSGLSSQRRALYVSSAGLALAAAAYAFWPRLPADRPVQPTRVERIAVLPFDNLSGDASQDFFADGMTDELITRIAQTGHLTVISRTSVMAFRHTHESMSSIGRRLQVQAIVEGAVLHAEDRVRITVSLVDVASERQIWSNSFERDYHDVLRMQSEIARAVARQVEGRLSPEGEKRLASAAAVNPEAYEQYLLGRHYSELRNAEDAERGVKYLEQAAAIDPGSAAVHVALAKAYRERETWAGLGVGTSADLVRAEVRRAIELDPGLADAHMQQARSSADYDWDWPTAERGYQVALRLNPSLEEAHTGYALLLQTLGRDEEAVRETEQALALQPLSQAALSDAGRILYRARRYGEAMGRFDAALKIDANFVPVLLRRLDVLFVTDRDRYRASAVALESQATRLPTFALDLERARVAALVGNQARARAIASAIEKASQSSRRGGENSFTLALIYAALSDRPRTLSALEDGVRAKSLFPLQLRDPQLDLVRESPSFKALLAQLRMGP